MEVIPHLLTGRERLGIMLGGSGGQGVMQQEARSKDLFPNGMIVRQNLWPYPMLQNPAFIRACPGPGSPDSVDGIRDKRGESMTPRVLSLMLLGGSGHLQPTCPTASPRDGKTPLPLLPPLSAIEETEISSRPGSSSVPTLAKRGLGFGLRWQKIGAKGAGVVVLLLNRRASAAHMVPPRTSIGWRVAVPNCVGVWAEKDSQELRVMFCTSMGFGAFLLTVARTLSHGTAGARRRRSGPLTTHVESASRTLPTPAASYSNSN